MLAIEANTSVAIKTGTKEPSHNAFVLRTSVEPERLHVSVASNQLCAWRDHQDWRFDRHAAFGRRGQKRIIHTLADSV
ncbi:hypothetical protein WT91_29690 [Burkholderia stagnalis]|nr:hypothetical protein WT91_29690 [Burkholderia stagnalis]